ncbi:MAG: hypothetical protein HGB26_01500 [Desulfobulbaceae bacterium]|nr:hypothetical protein [Desulfobulbaceae bacterium]
MKHNTVIAIIFIVLVVLAYFVAGTDDRMADLTPEQKSQVVARWAE